MRMAVRSDVAATQACPILATPQDVAVATRSPLLRLQGLTKRFGAMTALQGVSLDIVAGEVQCLLGENGAGKSTLCNLVFGVHSADAGTMLLDGVAYQPTGPADALKRGIAMVHQHFSLVPDASVTDNLLLGQAHGVLDRKAAATRIRKLVEEYGLQLDRHALIRDLSVGERQRVEIVKCLMREPRLLVMDEPTAVLLPDEIASLLQVCRKVAQRGCSVLLVTHKLAEIRQIADRVSVLSAGMVVAESVDPDADMERLVAAMMRRDVDANLNAGAAADADADADADGSRDNEANRSGPGAVAPSLLLRSTARPVSGAPAEGSHDLREEVLLVDGLGVIDAQGVTRLDNVTMVVNRSEIVGVAGVEGNGQSELSAVLSGLIPASSGRFFVSGQLLNGRSPGEITASGVGVVPEDRHAVGCIGGLSLAENLFLNQFQRFCRWGRIDRVAMRRAARGLMQRYDIRAVDENVAFSSLSGGNQQKAVLARELGIAKLSLLVAAQPTRGLDVGAVQAVYNHIRAARDTGAAVLLISSELDDLLEVADRIVVLYRGRMVGTCAAHPSERARIGAMMAGHA